jgi:hypothetical protein
VQDRVVETQVVPAHHPERRHQSKRRIGRKTLRHLESELDKLGNS